VLFGRENCDPCAQRPFLENHKCSAFRSFVYDDDVPLFSAPPCGLPCINTFLFSLELDVVWCLFLSSAWSFFSVYSKGSDQNERSCTFFPQFQLKPTFPKRAAIVSLDDRLSVSPQRSPRRFFPLPTPLRRSNPIILSLFSATFS